MQSVLSWDAVKCIERLRARWAKVSGATHSSRIIAARRRLPVGERRNLRSLAQSLTAGGRARISDIVKGQCAGAGRSCGSLDAVSPGRGGRVALSASPRGGAAAAVARGGNATGAQLCNGQLGHMTNLSLLWYRLSISVMCNGCRKGRYLCCMITALLHLCVNLLKLLDLFASRFQVNIEIRHFNIVVHFNRNGIPNCAVLVI